MNRSIMYIHTRLKCNNLFNSEFLIIDLSERGVFIDHHLIRLTTRTKQNNKINLQFFFFKSSQIFLQHRFYNTPISFRIFSDWKRSHADKWCYSERMKTYEMFVRSLGAFFALASKKSICNIYHTNRMYTCFFILFVFMISLKDVDVYDAGGAE